MGSDSKKFDIAAAASLLLQRCHTAKLDLRYHAHGTDWAELELPWREDLAGEASSNTFASGPIISLLDMASGLSIWTTLGEFRTVATLDLRVDYQRPARKGASLIGHAECYRLTNSAAFVRGYAHDGDPKNSVATMAGTFMAVKRVKKHAVFS